jgi:hypothetical protein
MYIHAPRKTKLKDMYTTSMAALTEFTLFLGGRVRRDDADKESDSVQQPPLEHASPQPHGHH